MGYVLKAVLSSAQHPEYGQITVPFPIPDEKYDRMIELLEPLEIGDALRQDCRVDELDSFYTVLNRLVGSLVNFDELDYLAKRLDSFDDGEAAQFQGMACKLGVSNIKDFINLTFCCQQATVITDFSDLDAIGRQHYMTMQGGGCRIEELERLDGRKFALDLILNHLEGRITPYGVVYDNGMKLEQLYDGRHFPCYHYIKGGTSSATAHLENYVKYMATRNGVERIDPGRSEWPATSKQKKMVEQILRDFPLSRGMFEYEDYAAEPTRTNASEFITRALEDNYNQIAKKDNYLKYIATRPRAQRVGSHGLFTGEEDQLVLAQVAEAVAAHPGNVWLPIISLRREDAARLGYDKAEEWKALLSEYAMEMAEAMKIPWEDFRWYAAFHDEAHHPHIHMVCYSADPSKGFLTTQGIAQIKSGLAKEIFRQELTELYQQQTQSRDTLNEDARSMWLSVVRRNMPCCGCWRKIQICGKPSSAWTTTLPELRPSAGSRMFCGSMAILKLPRCNPNTKTGTRI